MWPDEQYEIYGMLAYLLETEAEHDTAESMRLETKIEGMEDQVAKGEAEMKVWLRLYAKRGLKKRFQKRIDKYVPFIHNPLTIH